MIKTETVKDVMHHYTIFLLGLICQPAELQINIVSVMCKFIYVFILIDFLKTFFIEKS